MTDNLPEKMEENNDNMGVDSDDKKSPIFKFANPGMFTPGTPRAKMTSYMTEMEVESIVQKMLRPLQDELKQTKVQLATEKKETQELKERLIRLESFGRRHNLRFIGIREQMNETKQDCKRHILNILHQTGYEIPPKAIESAHRVGPRNSQKNSRPRYILVKLFHLEDKDFILLRHQNIRNACNILVEEDFPHEIDERRRILRPVMLAASSKTQQNGKNRYSASLNVDKLVVNGKSYSTKTTVKLPNELQLKNISTLTRGTTTAFFTANSPLSNHHIANQTVNNQIFNCNEQFYMYAKAKKFNDHETAKKIMLEKKSR